MGAALGGFLMLYFFSVMEKFVPSQREEPQVPEPQPTLEQLFGPEEVSADAIPLTPEPVDQEPKPRKRKIIIREYYDEPSPKRTRSAKALQQKIQALADKASAVRSKPPTRRTPMERCRLATLPLLQSLLTELQADPTKEHDISRKVEELMI